MRRKGKQDKSRPGKGRNKWLHVGNEPARWKLDMLVQTSRKKLNPVSIQAPQR